ncbi:MAG: hypothetical protein O3B89_07325 [Verrucomicrobia bacterium]|jgi:hypothetical protein|nr:hypothetical protein [Verrucomicrobiota bacterium]
MRKGLPLLAVICLAVASPFFYPYAKNLGFDKFSSRDASANALKSKEVTGAVAKTQREAKSSVVLQKVGAGQVGSISQKPNLTASAHPRRHDPMGMPEAERSPWLFGS